jgi:hypothetical protein
MSKPVLTGWRVEIKTLGRKKFGRGGAGSTDMLVWDCVIPGKKDTLWDTAYLPLVLRFSEEYPEKPPTAHFPAGFFHPNIYPSGKVCLVRGAVAVCVRERENGAGGLTREVERSCLETTPNATGEAIPVEYHTGQLEGGLYEMNGQEGL